jgi:hypothetical protein
LAGGGLMALLITYLAGMIIIALLFDDDNRPRHP